MKMISREWNRSMALMVFCSMAYAAAGRDFSLDKQVLEKTIILNQEKGDDADRLVLVAKIINEMKQSDDRLLLSYLDELSMRTNVHTRIRECAAAAYVKIANLDESVEFMRKLYKVDWDGNTWRWPITECFLEKVKHAENNSWPTETRDAVYEMLVKQIQNPSNTRECACIDNFLITRLSEYSVSQQRAVLAQTYANRGNEWMTNTFNPIKEHFDKIPPSKRIDLRNRFPSLPPLTENKAEGKPLKVALAVGALAVLVAVCVAGWITTKRRRIRNHADGQPNLR